MTGGRGTCVMSETRTQRRSRRREGERKERSRSCSPTHRVRRDLNTIPSSLKAIIETES